MNLKENIRLAWEGLRANKMRALLTMLGIIIGIASVIGILTVGNSLSGSVMDSMSSLGATNITIQVKERDEEEDQFQGPMMQSTGENIEEENRLTDEMISELESKYGEEIKGVSLSESVGNGKATLDRDYANIAMTGINTSYISINSVDIIKGRNFLERDIEGKRNVVIVSDKLVNNLYQGDVNKAIGQELIVNINSEILVFRIIGVYEYVES
ncbi:MAG: ABC transporter permease, partial [Clostridiales bacterium]|nr:ABC transporter permease [Clostridiales bacterium]